VSFLETCEEQGKDGVCPICSSGPVKEGDLLEVIVKESDTGEDEGRPKVVFRKNDFISSTKIDALVRNLREFFDPFGTTHPDTPITM
jgi:DNA repair protein RAD5